MTTNTGLQPSTRSMEMLAGLLFGLLIIFLATFSWYSWQTEKEYMVKELGGNLRFGADFCEGYFDRIEVAQRKLGTDVLQHQGQIPPDEAMSLLRRYKGLNRDQLGFMLIAADGEVIADTEHLPDQPRSSSLSGNSIKQLLAEVQRGRSLTFEQIQAEGAEGKLVLPLSYPIKDAGGNLKYVIRSRLQIGLLQVFWKTALVPQESVLGFMHDSGQVIARYSANPGLQLEKAFDEPSARALSNHLQLTGFSPSGYTEVQSGTESSRQLVVYRHLTYYPVAMFISIPMTTVWRGWWSRVQIPFVLCFVLLVGGFLSYRLMYISRQAEGISGRKQAQLHDIARGILVAQEHDRARISHELHDEIGQSLTALKITLNRARQSASDSERVESCLDDGQRILEDLMRDVRGIAYRLRPAEIEQLGLVAALRSYLDKAIRPLGQNASLVENIGEKRLPASLELCCFRVAQESLTNCLRHAKASQLEVSVTYAAPWLTLSVKDNGIGFDISRYFFEQQVSKSLGLVGIRERVTANGGTLRIDSVPGKGTEVIATFDIDGVI